MYKQKLRKFRDIVGTILVVCFLLLIWGAYIGSFVLSILYFIFPDTWIDPLAHTYLFIYPGNSNYECVSDYMGGCI